MVSAEAKNLDYLTYSPVQTRIVRRKKINKARVVQWLIISGIFLSLMFVNSVIQALLAQTQMQLEVAQSTIENLDKELGRLRYEVADLSSYARVERIASTRFNMLRPAGVDGLNFYSFSPTQPSFGQMELPMAQLTIKQTLKNRENTKVTQKIGGWIAGLDRTLAGEDLN